MLFATCLTISVHMYCVTCYRVHILVHTAQVLAFKWYNNYILLSIESHDHAQSAQIVLHMKERDKITWIATSKKGALQIGLQL
jgi:hypothetical protein